jgi:hypothetical protein
MLWNIIAWIVVKPPIANWLIKRAMKTPYTHINQQGSDQTYMGRWWLFNPYDNTTRKTKYPGCPISIRVHHICQPDADKHLHDHPWNARTIILKGAYIEKRGRELFARLSGCTAPLRFGEYHKIETITPDGVWTLFITGKYRGTWGFLVEGVKVPYREYLGLGDK